jgi:hypothetical protein
LEQRADARPALELLFGRVDEDGAVIGGRDMRPAPRSSSQRSRRRTRKRGDSGSSPNSTTPRTAGSAPPAKNSTRHPNSGNMYPA